MDETRNNLSKNQKLALGGLTVFGIFIIGLWVFTLNQQINNPLSLKNSKNASADVKKSVAVVSEEEKQRTEDTDGDGLFNWDELNVYKTSPYIADSDSDGISDGTEVKNGADPNCPEGKDCGIATSLPMANTDIAGDRLSSSSLSEIGSVLADQVSAESLRKQLLDAGLDKKSLDQVNDEDLVQGYLEAIASSTKK